MKNINTALINNIHSASIIKINFYNYFYKVFSNYPDKDFIGITSKLIPYFEELKKHILSNEYSMSVNILKGYSQYEQSIKEDDMEDFLEYMQDIYSELFVVDTYCIPCTASSYLSAYGKLQHRECGTVQSIYELNNFIIPEQNEFPYDHISVEMLYMQQLNSLMISAIDNKEYDKVINILQAQYNFLQAHIITWITEFVVHLQEQIEKKDTSLYYGIAGILKEFIKYDKQLTEEFLTSVKKYQ